MVGIFILLAALAAAVLLWVTIGARIDINPVPPVEAVFFGWWELLYAPAVPPARVLWAAVGVAMMSIAVVAAIEHRVSSRSRTSLNRSTNPLSPRVVMEKTQGVFYGEITVTVLIPAHNEEAALAVTVPALLAESRRPDRVIVVADNCTDRTVEVAQSFGVEVHVTENNSERKAGALNQVLKVLLPGLGENDVVMVMDADTTLDDGFVAAAVDRFTDDRGLMAVGGIFYGEEGHGLIGQFQRNEYARYSRLIARRRGRVFVLTGTSSMFRSRALKTVAQERGHSLPGRHGDVYDTVALTEDNELTIALKTLGALMISPARCSVVTELMPSWTTLWRQRLRWQRGALENLGAYGFIPSTLRYWGQQAGIGYGVIALGAFFLLMLLTILAIDTWIWFPFWLGIGMIFVSERVVTVWRGGWRSRLLAATLFPELIYDLFLDVVYIKGIIDITLSRKARWGHVQHATSEGGMLK
jgi:cellulose synthase/poly-beta-1,6-N-acetylglucosamine synthase-like glycosyltransferase